MHIELVVPALFAAQDLPPVSMPALELLLARGRRSKGEPASLESWLLREFGLDGTAIPAGSLTALAHGVEPGARQWLRADPVHLRADRDRLLLVPSQAFSITAEEAQALTGALAPLLAGKFALHALAPDQWCLEMENESGADNMISPNARAPIELAGANIDPHLPPKAWHGLLTELQMALYDHPVNTARERRGDPTINSLWFWGAGKLPAGAAGPWHSLTADDAVALGLARSAGIRHRAAAPIGSGAAAWLGRAPEDGRHLVVLDDLRGVAALGDLDGYARRLQALETDWFAPLLAALKTGRTGMVTIHAPEAAASFEAARADLHRFWRRPRPLAAYA